MNENNQANDKKLQAMLALGIIPRNEEERKRLNAKLILGLINVGGK